MPKKLPRFDEISPAVWQLYDTRKEIIDPEEKAFIQEYRARFNEIAKKPLVPYLAALTPAFFRWLEAASK